MSDILPSLSIAIVCDSLTGGVQTLTRMTHHLISVQSLNFVQGVGN